MVDKITAIDFTAAEYQMEDKQVDIHTLDGMVYKIEDVQGIAMLVSSFVPQAIQLKYKGKVTLVNNPLEN
jgi:hypothetical protein